MPQSEHSPEPHRSRAFAPQTPGRRGLLPSRAADVVSGALSRAGAALDRGALRVMQRAMQRSTPRPPRDARALLRGLAARYNRGDNLGPDSAVFPEPDPPEVSARSIAPRLGAHHVVNLSFRSGYQPYISEYRTEFEKYRANLTVRARWYQGPVRRPVIVCLHGWGGGAFAFEERAFPVAYFLRIGLDVVLMQLPFHGRRAPRQAPISGALFPTPHVVRTNEGFAQAIHDVRALARWLRARKVPAVGVAGMSLGGYTTALWASLDDRLAFAIPIIPAVCIADLFWRHGADVPARRRAEQGGVDRVLLARAFAIHAPLTRAPRVAHERLLILAGRGDRITPPDHADMLWEHWRRPAVHWFPGGHLAQFGRGDAFRAIREHLTQIDLIPRKTQRQKSGPRSRLSSVTAVTAR